MTRGGARTSCPKGELLSVEALRGICAVCIVGFHGMLYAEVYLPRYGLRPGAMDRGLWHEWLAATPVDLFFVISGFVLYRLVTTRSVMPGRFFYLRASRIAGLYWLLSVVFLVVFVWFGAHRYRPDYVLKSFFLVPVIDARGFPTPMIFVAWTLTYELLFYLALTLALVLRDRIPVLLTASGLLGALYLAALVGPDELVALKALGNEVLLEFIPGMLLAGAFAHGGFGRGAGALLLAAGVLLWLQLGVVTGHRLIDGCVPAALVLTGALTFERQLRASPMAGLAKMIGNSTYSIYLIQVFSLPLAYHFLGRLGLLQSLSRVPMLLAVTVISVACGVATYYAVEVRINAWRKRLLPGRP